MTEQHPVAALFASEIEAIGLQAMLDGIPTDQFWNVIASFVGYSLGRAENTTAVAVQNGSDQFAKMVRDRALESFLEARKEKANG